MSVPWRTSATTSVEIKIATIKNLENSRKCQEPGSQEGKREAGKVNIALEDGGCASMATPAVAVYCSSYSTVQLLLLLLC